jgi:hypothetical protein
VATETTAQRHRVRRLLLLFALLAAVFTMHSLDAPHATAAPVTAPMAMDMPMDMRMDMAMPALPDHAADRACHDMAQMAGGCLALLVGVVALGGLRRGRGLVALPASEPARPAVRSRPTPRAPAPPGPPDLTLLSICRT